MAFLEYSSDIWFRDSNKQNRLLNDKVSVRPLYTSIPVFGSRTCKMKLIRRDCVSDLKSWPQIVENFEQLSRRLYIIWWSFIIVLSFESIWIITSQDNFIPEFTPLKGIDGNQIIWGGTGWLNHRLQGTHHSFAQYNLARRQIRTNRLTYLHCRQ